MNTISSFRKYLEMFQETYSNALTESSPLAQQPPHITPPLRIHQLASIHAMKTKEEALKSGLQISNNTVFSKYAFLGDNVGVGKTFMVLGHISQMALEGLEEQPIRTLHHLSTSPFFSLSLDERPVNLYNSLIIVPHTIYRQWQDTIKSSTTLRCVFLKTQKDLDKENFIDNLQASHLTLVSNTLLPILMNSLRAREIVNPTWRRVFYDEADTIRIPSTCIPPQGLMTWYITASFVNLLFTNQYHHSYIARQIPSSFVETLHPELQEALSACIAGHPTVTFFRTQSHGFFTDNLKSVHPLRSHLIIRNSKEFLDKSIQLPPLISSIIRCDTPITHTIVHNIIPAETQTMLNAGDLKGALTSLGIPSHTPMTIVEAVTAFRKKEIERLERLLVFKSSETYSTEQAKELALSALQEKITRKKQQIEIIKQRIQDAAAEICSICFDQSSADSSVITPCCSKIFCTGCILPWLQRNPACPLCRTSFHPRELTELSNESRTPFTQTPTLPKKKDALLKILRDNPTGRFLIFSRFENPLIAIQEEISITHPSSSLQGNKDVIAHILKEFETGTVKVLLLNSRNAAAGINIPTATHVILLHKMIPEEEKQILGRAYRLGRKEPLNFIKLLNENE